MQLTIMQINRSGTTSKGTPFFVCKTKEDPRDITFYKVVEIGKTYEPEKIEEKPWSGGINYIAYFKREGGGGGYASPAIAEGLQKVVERLDKVIELLSTREPF